MAKAIWNNIVIAESDETIIVEGNHYFQQSAVNQAYVNENSYNLPLAPGKAQKPLADTYRTSFYLYYGELNS